MTRPTPARDPPSDGLKAFAAPVNWEELDVVALGPTGVLVAEEPEPVEAVTVPLVGGVEEPVPVAKMMLVDSVLLDEAVPVARMVLVDGVLEGGQIVVVKVSIVVVEPVVIVVVPVEVVVPDAEVVDIVALDELVGPVVKVEEILEEIGVQFGSVIVELPQPPDEHSTTQFLEQAASPAVGVLCQQAA